MYKENDNSMCFGIGILAGIVAGVVAAVLLTPKSGEAMRTELKKTADKFTDTVPQDVKEATETSLEMIDRVKVKIEKQLQKVQDALKAGRMAAAKKKEEAETGVEF